MKLKYLGPVFLLLSVQGCNSQADKLGEQYAMLKESGAKKSDLCIFSTKASNAYFEERNELNFLSWEKTRKSDCENEPSTLSPPTGIIKGSVTYPSNYIPKDLQVCSRNTTTKLDKCIRTDGEKSYSMRLEPGKYLIWSKTNDWDGRAFYSKAVVCGLSIECTNHEPIEVTVEAGQTVRGIDPGDWYASK